VALRPRRARGRRALARGVVGLIAAGAAAGALAAACGASASQLSVSISAASKAKVKPGDTADYTMTIVNKGPGEASGVIARLDLPADFIYEATPGIDRDPIGALRIELQDPAVHTQAPSWGTWRLSPPTVNADGTPRLAFVSIHFTISANGAPGDYRLTPRVASDAADEVSGDTLAVHLSPAANLTLSVAVSPETVKRGDELVYHVSVFNVGSGAAQAVSLLVSLPEAITFVRTDRVEGNSSRDAPIDPVTGALLVYYGGYVVPARTDTSPGSLEIWFRARCSPFATGGRFTATAQLADGKGEVLSVTNQAAVTIDAPIGAPTPSSHPETSAPTTPTPRPTPVATPTPTPKRHH